MKKIKDAVNNYQKDRNMQKTSDALEGKGKDKEPSQSDYDKFLKNNPNAVRFTEKAEENKRRRGGGSLQDAGGLLGSGGGGSGGNSKQGGSGGGSRRTRRRDVEDAVLEA